ncbi:hypothetical protein FRC12_015467 [Ceratobasidium sp. 428]|nr:hypothetical protein FRC12_015467 [Ceratobasidium sp. 428]
MNSEATPLLSTAQETRPGERFGRENVKNALTEITLLLKFAVPVFGAQILEYSLILVSAVSLGHLSTQALAASSLSSITATVTGLSLVHGFASALDSLLPQAWTSERPGDVGLWAQRMIVVEGIVMVPVVGIWLNAEPILLHLRQEPEIARLAGIYLRWFTLCLPGLIVSVVTRRYLQAQGIMHAQTIVTAIAAPANLFLNWLLVWGPPPFRLGFIGAPIASSLSFTLMAVVSVLYTYLYVPKTAWHPVGRHTLQGLGRLFKLGLEGTGQIASEWWSWEFIGLTSSQFGPISLASQSVLLISASVAFQAPYSLGMAATVRVGNALGAGNAHRGKVAAQTAIGMSVVIALIMSTIIMLSRNRWSYMFNDDKEVAGLVSNVLPLLALFQIVDGATAVTDGVLRATGRLGYGAVINLTAYYCVGIPLAMYLAFWRDMKLKGLWTGITAALFYAATVSVYLVLRTDWSKEVEKAKKRLERENEAEVPHSSV